MGTVQTCIGDACPYGACDGAFGTPCPDVYPGPIECSTLCSANGVYCVGVISRDISYFVVACDNAVATVTRCSGGCGAPDHGAATCN